MKKFLFIIIFFITSCGYQPIYLNTNLDNFEFYKINLKGDNSINKRLLDSLSIKESSSNEKLAELSLSSYFKVDETSKNSKGQILSYRSSIIIDLKIIQNKNILKNKTFSDEFTYNKKDNKFELTEYQNDIKNQLINKAVEDIILFLNM